MLFFSPLFSYTSHFFTAAVKTLTCHHELTDFISCPHGDTKSTQVEKTNSESEIQSSWVKLLFLYFIFMYEPHRHI